MSIHTNVLASTGGPVEQSITSTAGPVAASGFEDASITLSFATLLAGYTDSSDATMKVSSIAAVAGETADGVFTVDKADQTVTFMPTAGFTGEVVAKFAISDGQGGHSTGELDLTVAAPTWVGGIPAPNYPGYYGWGDWSTGANWSSGEAPSADEAITISGSGAAGSFTGVLVSSADQALSLNVEPNANLDLVNGGSLTLTQGLTLGGILYFDGGQATITSPTLTIEAGSQLDDRNTGEVLISGEVVNNGGSSGGFPYFDGMIVDGDVHITGALAGSGTADVYGAARLDVDGAVSNKIYLSDDVGQYLPALTPVLALGDAKDFTGSVVLSAGDIAPSGVISVTTNAEASAGGVIDLLGVKVASATYNGVHLTVTRKQWRSPQPGGDRRRSRSQRPVPGRRDPDHRR